MSKFSGILRLSRYSCVGGGTFLIDLAILYFLKENLNCNPVHSAAVAFFIAVSLNYLLSRKFVFRGTERKFKEGYLGFLIIAGSGLLIVTGGMHALVTLLGWQYLLSRILISLVTGLWNYLLNLHVNFKVAGKHL